MADAVELREARYDDPEVEYLVSQIFAYYRELYQGRQGGGGGNRTSVPEAYLPPEGLFLIAWAGGTPVGCGGYRQCEVGEGAAELKRMWVEPDQRGKGIARLLLSELESRAALAGYTRMMLDTGPLQTRAVEIYEVAGYGRIPNYGSHAGNERLVSFAKELPAPRS